jgi:hypothetical protein
MWREENFCNISIPETANISDTVILRYRYHNYGAI